jgi:ferric-dicitrate binding protein FerR (iron transport regulator)
MEKNFFNVEDIIADEGFQNWYFGTDKARAAEWQAFMSANPPVSGLVAEARAIMDSLSMSEKEVAKEKHVAAEKRLMESIGANTQVISIKRRRNGWWAAAAAVAVLAVSSIVLWITVNKNEMVQTTYGEIRTQQLPEGSKVMLNANSEISFSEGWDKGAEREVWLKGEAFFQVQKTPSKSRFVVHGNQFDVIVTGTQFNVVNRHDKTNVMLTEGSVIIKTTDGKEIHMQPGDFVEINNKQPEKKSAQEENILAWRDKKLFFDNTPLKDAVKKIEDHYGVSIKITNDSIGNKTIFGVVPNDNLDVLLQALEAMEFHVERNQDNIVISGD